MSYHKGTATYVEHVQLKVEDLERAVRFYRDMLGFQVLAQSQDRAKLSADGTRPLLSLVRPEGVTPKQERRAGLYHFALLLPTRSDLARMVTYLVRQGIRFGSADHLVSEAIYFSDPDGNGIEIYSDTDPDTWHWSETGVEMDSVPLDFDDLLKEGAPQDESFQLPEKTVIGHLHLHVSYLDEAEEFYTEGLGFEIATRYGESALFLSTSRYHHHIALNIWNGVGAPPTPPESVGLDFFTIVYPDAASRQQALEQLAKLGVTVQKDEERYLVKDPAGNRMELGVQA